MAMKKKHPGFATVQSKIAKKQGISKERAGAILALTAISILIWVNHLI